MQKLTVNPFMVIGIAVRTTNENQQAAQDIPKLWQKFMSQGVLDKIPNKITSEILSIYTNYESDYTKPYDTILGCKVDSLDSIPEGMVGYTFEGGEYMQFIAKGNLNEGVVYNTWLDIWQQDLKRSYTVDFEVYGEKSSNPKYAEVPIFIAVDE